MAAERAAWDFMKKLSNLKKLELVVLNPGFMIGPNINTTKFSQGETIKNILINKIPGIPKVKLASVDVRDVA